MAPKRRDHPHPEQAGEEERGPAHQQLRVLHDRLRREAGHREDDIQAEDALQVMLECERSARDLYLRYLDRVTDGEIVDVLRSLAREEEQQAAIVQAAMERLRAKRVPQTP